MRVITVSSFPLPCLFSNRQRENLVISSIKSQYIEIVPFGSSTKELLIQSLTAWFNSSSVALSSNDGADDDDDEDWAATKVGELPVRKNETMHKITTIIITFYS